MSYEFPDNDDDVIDSRQIIERIEQLRGQGEEAYSEAFGLTEDDDLPQDFDASEYLDEDDRAEYEALRELADEAEGSPDWQYGETLIRDSYFEDYARQLAEDCDLVKDDGQWPNQYIDWERAAEALQQDYFTVDFDGITYWIRH